MTTTDLIVQAWNLSVEADRVQRSAKERIAQIEQEANLKLQHLQNEVTKLRTLIDHAEAQSNPTDEPTNLRLSTPQLDGRNV